MTNYEKYKDEIISRIVDDFAMTKDGEITYCDEANCENCAFFSGVRPSKCIPKIEEWLNKEYHLKDGAKMVYRSTKNPKFITSYQGRIYKPNYTNDTAASLLREYISVGYEKYIYNPKELKSKDNMLYTFIRNHMRC